jgi:hypothetical protein
MAAYVCILRRPHAIVSARAMSIEPQSPPGALAAAGQWEAMEDDILSDVPGSADKN